MLLHYNIRVFGSSSREYECNYDTGRCSVHRIFECVVTPLVCMSINLIYNTSMLCCVKYDYNGMATQVIMQELQSLSGDKTMSLWHFPFLQRHAREFYDET